MPFTVEEFLGVFRDYNNSVYPFQFILFLSAIYVIYLAVSKKNYGSKVITWILVFYWLWIGVVYQIMFFTAINPAAYVFGIIFILQALLFIKAGIMDKKLEFRFKRGLNEYMGVLIILYALIIYPLLGMFFGHTYPENPTFGLPCPTTIFTFGILLWTTKKIPAYIIGIPLIWSIVGFSAAINLGIKEDTGLLITGVLAAALIIKDKVRERNLAAES
jgi:hypothetical protein